MKLGLKTQLSLERTMCAMVRCTSSGLSLFLEDLELAKVALRCHIAWICCAKKCLRHGSWVDAARGASVSKGRDVVREKRKEEGV